LSSRASRSLQACQKRKEIAKHGSLIGASHRSTSFSAILRQYRSQFRGVPLGYTLYRNLKARGVLCYVCAPDSSEQQRKRRKNNRIDARSLTSKLFNYLNGDQEALQLARVPTEAQEQLRAASRQYDQLVEERKRLGAKGNGLLLSQGFGSWSNWWRPKAWAQLSCIAPQWLLERLKIWVDVLKDAR
jgi:transposase